ncbi:MAG: hypothetical protein OEM84_02520 [Acidimicrobiia bacterium]|nr:hypothetical protein [Acidimicrobiia bacterium]
MSRRTALAVAAVVLFGSCSRLGVGIPECERIVNNPSPAMVLSLQAVPTAMYAPCINSLQLGWDNLDFEVESGKASFSITHADMMAPFFTATLTEKCDIGNATPVPHPDIEKYELIRSIGSDIKVTIIPSAEGPLIHARTLAEEFEDVRVDGRRVLFTVDPDITFAVRSRVNRALFTNQFVWIISELDVNEDTLEMRSTPEGEGARGLAANEALQRIEELAPEVVYEGNWYFVFDGGCITYEFDAHGTVAETVADDVVTSLGFYPLADLRELGRRQGIDVGVPGGG